jgi:hypothetical protein
MGDVSRTNNKRKQGTYAGRNRRTQIDGQFAARLIDMLRSPAWSVLSLSACRVLDRVENERADHGGMDNGKLPITYDDFEHYGIHRHAIAPAIRECVALGFLEVTEVGRAGNADWRKPNLFRLTYKETNEAGPTHEWKRISAEEATAIARIARGATPKKQKSSGGKRQTPVATNSIVRKPPLAQCRKPPLLSISGRATHKETERPAASATNGNTPRSGLTVMDLMGKPTSKLH